MSEMKKILGVCLLAGACMIAPWILAVALVLLAITLLIDD